MSKQLTFDLFSDKYAWTKCDHKNNDFTVGYFTEVRPDGRTDRSVFDEKATHDLFTKWTEDRIPIGSMVRYSSLYPVLLHDFSKKKTKNRFVRYVELCEPVEHDGMLVYNGLYNSGRDPRHFASNDINKKDLKDLYRGCQAMMASCKDLAPDKDGFAHKIVVYVERINKEGGILFRDNGSVAQLKKMNRIFYWSLRLEHHVDRARSEDFPYAQPASCVWFRPAMGVFHLNCMKVCRDLESDLIMEN